MKGLLVPALSVAIVTTGWISSALAATAMFAGITGIETRFSTGNEAQIIEFRSDLPFQYQLQILNKNRVVLRLYNARIASSLLTPEGDINLLAGGAVESATLRKPDSKKIQADEYEEIILSGFGLGEKKLQIQGATELAVVRPFQIPKAQVAAALPKPGKPVKPVVKMDAPTPATAMLAHVNEDTNSHKPQPRIEIQESDIKPIAAMSVLDAEQTQSKTIPATLNQASPPVESGKPLRPVIPPSGPAIESVMNTPSLPPSYQRQPQIVGPLASQTQFATSVPVEAEKALSADAGKASSPPEPSYQVMMAMPRYQGGAAPIQAVTLDERGRPIVVHPKNTPIADDLVVNVNDSYNTLFQADSPEQDDASSVDALIASALEDYQAKRFDKALSQVQEALRLDENNADLYAALGEIQLKLNQASAAVQAFQKGATLSASKYGPRYAEVLVSSGKKADAIRLLEELYQKDSSQAKVAYMLGTLYEERGNTAKALTYLKQAAQLHPASADIQYNLGLAYELSGDMEQAEKHYQQALTLNPDASDIRKALQRVRN